MKLTRKQQLKIYKYYLGDFTIGGAMRSILPGRNDSKPSFVVFNSSYNEEKILWKDYAKPCDGTDAIALVCEMEGICRTQAYDFFEEVIDKELDDEFTVNETIKTEPTIEVKDYEDYELGYWAERYVDKDTLLSESIYAGKYIRYNSYTSLTSDIGNPMYFYLFNEQKTSWKAYKPLDKTGNKWKTHNIRDVIEGINTIPRSYDSLIIASSTKDRLAWKRFHPAVINPTAEGSFRNILLNFSELYLRFNNIYCIFDADNAGWESSQKLSSLTGGKIKAIKASKYTPFYCKDIDEMVVKHGPYVAKSFLEKANVL